MPSRPRELSLKLLAVSDVEWAYVAGIVDGEGHFHGSLKTNTPPGIAVKMVEPQVPQWLHGRLGGSLHQQRREAPKSDVWEWRFSGQRDLYFACQRLLPFLRLKADECAAMIRYLEHCFDRPTYDVPTSAVHGAERVRRTAAWDEWREHRRALAEDIRTTRNRRKAEHMVCSGGNA